MKVKAIVLLVLCSVVLMCSFCVFAQSNSEVIHLNMVVPATGIPNQIVDSSDDYSVGFQRQEDGTIRLTYYDHDLMKLDYYKTFSHSGFVERGEGGICPIVQGDTVFLIKVGVVDAGESTGSFIEKFDTRTNEGDSISLSDNYTIDLSSGIAFDGTDLYFVRLKVKIDNGFVYEAALCKTNFREGVVQEIYSFPYAYNEKYSIYGAYNDLILLQKMTIPYFQNDESFFLDLEHTSFSLIPFSVNKNILVEPIKEWENGETSTAVKENLLYSILNNKIICNDMVKGTEQTVTIVNNTNDSYDYVLTGSIFDDHAMAYAIKDDTIVGYGGIDLHNGQYQKVDLMYFDSDGVDYPTTIISETNDKFLVMCGAEYISLTKTFADGSEYTYERRVEKYGLIEKSNYWNSINDIQMFEDQLTY